MQAALGFAFIGFGMLMAGVGIQFMMSYMPIIFFIWLVVEIFLITNAIKINKTKTALESKKIASILAAGAFLVSIPGCLTVLLKPECIEKAKNHREELLIEQCFWLNDQ